VTKRYSIFGREHGADREALVCEVDSNPEAIVQALKNKKSKLGKFRTRTVYGKRYDSLRLVDNDP
jgi:hypothetical protein